MPAGLRAQVSASFRVGGIAMLLPFVLGLAIAPWLHPTLAPSGTDDDPVEPPPPPPPPPDDPEDPDPPSGVPEPSTILLLGLGLPVAAGVRYLRGRRNS